MICFDTNTHVGLYFWVFNCFISPSKLLFNNCIVILKNKILSCMGILSIETLENELAKQKMKDNVLVFELIFDLIQIQIRM